MNRTGLLIALAIGVCVGVVFAVWPQLDIAISRYFFNEQYRVFPVQYSLVARHLRDLFTYGIAALAAPAFIALAIKLVLPRRRMLISSRAALFLIATLALGPGLVTNVILKDNWGRPRPPEVTQFNGPEQFRPWWDPRGPCERNCSFVAGEGAGGFWTLAPAALAPPHLRPVRLCGRACVRLRRRISAAFRRCALLLGCRFLRCVHIHHHLAGSRLDLSMARDAADRRTGRACDRAPRAAHLRTGRTMVFAAAWAPRRTLKRRKSSILRRILDALT